MLCGNEKPQVRKRISSDIKISPLRFAQNAGVSQLNFAAANSQTIGRFHADLGRSDLEANNKLPDRHEPDFQECVDCPAGGVSEFRGKSSSLLRPLESYGTRLISFRRTDELPSRIKIDSSSVATFPGSKVFVFDCLAQVAKLADAHA